MSDIKSQPLLGSAWEAIWFALLTASWNRVAVIKVDFSLCLCSDVAGVICISVESFGYSSYQYTLRCCTRHQSRLIVMPLADISVGRPSEMSIVASKCLVGRWYLYQIAVRYSFSSLWDKGSYNYSSIIRIVLTPAHLKALMDSNAQRKQETIKVAVTIGHNFIL